MSRCVNSATDILLHSAQFPLSSSSDLFRRPINANLPSRRGRRRRRWRLWGDMTEAEQQPSGYAENDGVRVAYYETGRGSPLLLINGGPGFPSQHFGPLAER